MSAHCHLTRTRPLLGIGILGREQRKIPVLFWEWFKQEQVVGPVGSRAEIDSWSCLGMASRNRTSLKCTFSSILEVNFPEIKIEIKNNMDI